MQSRILIHQREGQRKRAPPGAGSHSQKPHPAPAPSPGVTLATGHTGPSGTLSIIPPYSPRLSQLPYCNLLSVEIPSLCTKSHRTQNIEWLLLIRRDTAGKLHIRRCLLSGPLLLGTTPPWVWADGTASLSQPEPSSPRNLMLSTQGGCVPRVSFSRF